MELVIPVPDAVLFTCSAKDAVLQRLTYFPVFILIFLCDLRLEGLL